MININLLIKSPPPVRWRVVARIAVAFGLAGSVGIGGYLWLSDLQRLRHELTETKKLMADYARVADQMPVVQAELEERQNQSAAVAEFARNQRFSQAAVLEVILVTPAGVRLTNALFSGTEVAITGQARSSADAREYLAYLRSAPLMREVNERSLRTIDSGATSFTFSARIRGEVTQP